MLWSHVLRANRANRTMPDVLTGWVRAARTPWAADTAPEEAAAAIAGASPEALCAPEAIDAVVALAEATRGLGDHAAGALRDAGERPKAWPWGAGRD